MEKTSTFQKIKYVNGWQGNEQMLWFHEVTMANGDFGKLDANSEEKPSWLTVGNTIRYAITFRQGKGMYIKVLAVGNGMQSEGNLMQEEPKAISNLSTSHLQQRKNPERQEQKKSFGRLDDDQDYWMARQRCISLTTCLDRANELVIAGKIKLDEKESQALSDFKFILKHSRLEAINQTAPDGETNKDSTMRENINAPEPELFEDTTPIPEFILIGLSRCETVKQLTNFKSQLLAEEKNNKKIMNAVSTKEAEIKSKK